MHSYFEHGTVESRVMEALPGFIGGGIRRETIEDVLGKVNFFSTTIYMN